MAEKKHNLYTVIEEAMSGNLDTKKPVDRKPDDQKRFNVYTAMGWTNGSSKKGGKKK